MAERCKTGRRGGFVTGEQGSGGESIVKQCMFSLSLAVVAATASAEMAEINVAQQYGVSFLPLMLMERDPLYLNLRRLPGCDPKAVTSAVVPAKALIATATI